MPWPMGSDYYSAVQNPKTNFNDPELAAGEVATNALGLPIPISGAFASVYKMKCPHGRVWAVRCFLREIADQQRRYAAISAQLAAAHLSCTVGFEYQERGILVNGHWYPILKMEWLDGLPINTYVENNLANIAALQALTKQWCEVVGTLNKVGIAHGDLQHGNILVCNHHIKLIDYDGMYVPALAGMTSNEDGHRNYQHPKRCAFDFKPNLDNFSAWVIFISLSAICIEPRLWRNLKCGDEHLLFRREDYERPLSSKVVRAIESTNNPQLQSLAAHLRGLLLLPLARMPALDGMVATSAAETKHSHEKVPDWLVDHLPEETISPLLAESEESEPVVVGATWLLDHVVDPKPLPSIASSAPVELERAVLAALALHMIISVLFFIFVMQSPLILAGMMVADAGGGILFFFRRYRKLSNVTKKLQLLAVRTEAQKAISQLDSALHAIKKERADVLEPLVHLDKKYRLIPHRVAQVQRDVSRKFSDQLHDMESRRVDLAEKLNSSLDGIDLRVRQKLSDLFHRRDGIARAESAERTRQLDHLRQAYVSNALNSAFLDGADIYGIGQKMKARLRAHGVFSAATVNWSVQQIPGIGQAKAATLVGWRRTIENSAIARAPSSLPEINDSLIRLQFANAKHDLEVQIVKEQQSAEREKDMENQNHLRYEQQLERERNALEQKFPAIKEKALRDLDLERERITKAFEAEKFKAEKSRKVLDGKAAEVNGSLFSKRVELGQLDRELSRYRGTTFAHYIRRVVLPMRTAA